jgi:hypothetical protein
MSAYRRKVKLNIPALKASISVLDKHVNGKEVDPKGLDPKTQGAKLDLGKPPVFQGVLSYFPKALNAVSLVSLAGAKKYHWKGWEKVEDGFNRYSDALGRHLLKESYELYDDVDDNGNEGTHLLHAAQVAWNSLSRLEFLLREHKVSSQG